MENNSNKMFVNIISVMAGLITFLFMRLNNIQEEVKYVEPTTETDDILEYNEQLPSIQAMSKYVVEEYDLVNDYMKEEFNRELEFTDAQAIEALRALYLEKYNVLEKEGLAENIPVTFDLYLEGIGYDDIAQWYIDTSLLIEESTSAEEEELKLALENRN